LKKSSVNCYKLGIINPSDLIEGVGGGATGFIAGIIHHFQAEKVIIFGIGKNKSIPWQYTPINEKVKFVPICKLKYPSKIPMRLKTMFYYFRFRRKILNSGVDLLYIHMPECCLPFLFYKNIPVIYHQHGSGNPVALSKFLYARGYFFRSVYELILKLIYRKADWIIAIDQLCNKKAIKNGAEKKTTLLMNAIDIKKYKPDEISRQLTRQKYGIKPEQYVILFVGRIEKTKGVFRLLNCITHLNSKKVHYHIFLAGDGSYLQNAKNYVEEKKIKDVVTLLGRVDHEKLPSYYNMADVLVLPSDMEGVPMVILESLSCGTPVVASRVGGIPDIVKDGRNGFLVDDLSPQNLTSILVKTLQMKTDRKIISSTVHQFSVDEFIVQFNNIIKKLQKGPHNLKQANRC
jgi:glycosyltransferase involved in cell wall biosynthesis